MRKALWRIGWSILFVLPIIYIIQIVLTQDLPPVAPWQWVLLFGVVAVLYFARDRDDVLKHHVIQ